MPRRSGGFRRKVSQAGKITYVEISNTTGITITAGNEYRVADLDHSAELESGDLALVGGHVDVLMYPATPGTNPLLTGILGWQLIDQDSAVIQNDNAEIVKEGFARAPASDALFRVWRKILFQDGKITSMKIRLSSRVVMRSEDDLVLVFTGDQTVSADVTKKLLLVAKYRRV